MIVAHPDDESLWGGANLYNYKYFVVCLTNGYSIQRANDYRKILKFTKNKGIILNYPDLKNNNIRDDWSEVKNGILKDLSTIISYKNWEKIVTHGPDGTTGHIHHKMTSEYITDIVTNNNEEDKLLYFGRYYFSGDIPEEDKKYYLNNDEYNFKTNILYPIYETQKNVLDYYNRMTRYETWISYNDWYNE